MKRALVLAAALLICACSGGGDSTEGSEADLRDAVETYVGAFADGDADLARSLQSERCVDQDEGNDTATAVSIAAEMYPDLAVESFRADIDGDTAVVNPDTGVDLIDAEGDEHWSFEDGSWRWDDC